ncbi:ABC transporter ATP-binding protein [Herbiconiux sp. KACC 21604]|uniref:ABC transporter ATP-binding protein n=1 Tax=unclassified Herbiconiux TaxID=2618217 RepID=UPI0014922A38|nr:ABC transporter ATP-binding protein [Herbiconiux sp. SALV-R1]QJU55309.1 ABC transporter ATP-binding protein [Herbiconiux sp. SALV-R1]WPO86477.1 ABC transporter ATP-binding protein [Herbiconiux sp. KACC 21604]
MLEVRGLRVEFGGVAAIHGVDVDIEAGTFVGLIGPNGAGKSTFINSVSGTVLPARGTIAWSGQRLDRLRADRIAARGVLRTFQHAHLFAGLSVLENVMIGAHRLGRTGAPAAMLHLGRWRDDEAELRRRAGAALERVHASHLADRSCEGLTAGQQRLVAVARALAGEPDLLLLDEPAAGLTDTERDVLARDLAGYFDDHDLTVLLVEHNLGFLMSLVSRIVVFDRGTVLAQGSPAEIRRDPAVITAYLGEAADAQR